jgi:hypothetical protein
VDLGFRRFEQDGDAGVMPAELAVLMIGAAARQAMSPTARIEARIDRAARSLVSGAAGRGAFNADVAAALITWKEE